MTAIPQTEIVFDVRPCGHPVSPAERDQLLRAMAALPAGQRAVLVLRYFEDLSEAQAAAALGCSVGSVKSQSARALARLRTVVGAPDEPDDRSPDSRRQEGGRRHGRS